MLFVVCYNEKKNGEMQPLPMIQAAENQAEVQTEASFLKAEEELEEGSYVEGEAIVSVEAGSECGLLCFLYERIENKWPDRLAV